MKTKNLNYAFNVEYYNGSDFDKKKDYSKKNEELVNIATTNTSYKNSAYTFTLQTRYPGLLVGVGNAHGSGGVGDIDLGFSFDYVTGCPYIPGSSVKGIMRSAFKHPDYIKSIIGEKDISCLEDEIFEGIKERRRNEKGEEIIEYIPVSLRDVFYDAFPETNGRIIAIENITPHGDLTKNPNPLTLLKVKPNVKFNFSFKLSDGLISASQKLGLFKQIITDLGAGAKTNVGFGVFTDTDFKFEDVSEAPQKQNSGAAAGGRKIGGKTMVECPACKTKNFKFFKDSQDVTPSWKKKICYKCKADLSSCLGEGDE